MDKLIKHGTIFALIGMLIILMHSMVPHEHEDKNKTTQSISLPSDNIADIILIDIGISHLENLNVEDSIILFFLYSFILYILNDISNKKLKFLSPKPSFLKTILSNELSHRGPPFSLV